MTTGSTSSWSWLPRAGNDLNPPALVGQQVSISGVQGQHPQEIILDEAANFMSDTLLCPLCSAVVPMETSIWRDHDVRGTRVRFQTCSECAHVSLCPANLHGIHGVIAEDNDWAGLTYLTRVQGHCVQCGTPMEWDGNKQRWCDPAPDPTVAAIAALNDRLQHGDMSMDEYLRELQPLVGVEGSDQAADGEGKEDTT